ncbi:putative 28S ribosomal protein S5, mitochondrial [Mya arenaria]|uniref:putative 28S ribosomal protein S5, mitochondrial n=1 Tax=Mya arenaria TaxID=6604 RepID=UPI0022E66E8F|nr:putative 28S ribosomal protein S5, mitochondrial [Mya arenaria]
MAASMLRIVPNFCKRVTSLDHVGTSVSLHLNSAGGDIFNQAISVRYGSFFNRKSAQQLWDSVTSVSSQGRKRGRASRGKLMERDVYSKPRHAIGQAKIVFPGLTERIMPTKDKNFAMPKMHKVAEIPETDDRKKKFRVFPKRTAEERGYSGRHLPGTKKGPPDPIDGYEFDGFQSIILSDKFAARKSATQGNVSKRHILMAVGNQKGLIGLQYAKSPLFTTALVNAKNKAGNHLIHIDLFENHTILHNFSETYHSTTVTAFPKFKGYGLVCHRVIKSLCELIGIKNIYVKVEGNKKNKLAMCRAFINGLTKQKSHQDIANETGYHVVEYRPKSYKDFPQVVASPEEDSKTESTFTKDHGFSYSSFHFGGRVPSNKRNLKHMFYLNFPSHKKRMFLDYKFRNQKGIKLKRRAIGIDGDDFGPDWQKGGKQAA